MYALARFSFECLDCYHVVLSLRSARNDHFVFRVRYTFDVSHLPSEQCQLRGACMLQVAIRAVGHHMCAAVMGHGPMGHGATADEYYDCARRQRWHRRGAWLLPSKKQFLGSGWSLFFQSLGIGLPGTS